MKQKVLTNSPGNIYRMGCNILEKVLGNYNRSDEIEGIVKEFGGYYSQKYPSVMQNCIDKGLALRERELSSLVAMAITHGFIKRKLRSLDIYTNLSGFFEGRRERIGEIVKKRKRRKQREFIKKLRDQDKREGVWEIERRLAKESGDGVQAEYESFLRNEGFSSERDTRY